jgi:serine/threonine protein kinase
LTSFLFSAKDIASGMRYISGQGIIHRDLAARNILLQYDKVEENDIVDSRFVVKIADFGLARRVEIAYDNLRSQNPIKWTAPVWILFFVFNILKGRNSWVSSQF